jgi:hypothetical protein
VDPIADIAAIAREAGVGMHVDACLGGFIVDNLEHIDGNFLAIPGVTSLSADTHKNGAPTRLLFAIFTWVLNDLSSCQVGLPRAPLSLSACRLRTP